MPRSTMCPTLGLLLVVCAVAAGGAPDLAWVTVFDAERSELLSNFGGGWQRGDAREISFQDGVVHGGRRALQVVLPAVDAGRAIGVRAGLGPHQAPLADRPTRDLRPYGEIELWLANDCGAAVDGTLRIVDARDRADHSATCRFSLPAERAWTRVTVPLPAAAPHWSIRGEVDLARALAFDLTFAPRRSVAGGRIYVDDWALRERGPELPIASAPVAVLAERLTQRQWRALWNARGRQHALVANVSDQATDAAINASAALLWTLPAAARRGWTTPAEADAYAAALAATVDRLLDDARYLPPRHVAWTNLSPSLLPEESSIDAAFLALAMRQYAGGRATPAELKARLKSTAERFNFAAFASPGGWRMAYRYRDLRSRDGRFELTYDGYTSEGNVISLAAHLSERHHVPIHQLWNSDIYRARGEPSAAVVHTLPEYRAPFTQALLNLFVDVRGRGPDRYRDDRLAVNPWDNFVCYQRHAMASLAKRGRPYLVQPDAGDDGTANNYRQFSVYEDFGRGDVFMPWSVGFALLAGAERAEDSLRFLLTHGLHGPMGLADSARWATGASAPSSVTARHDYWNTGLSTMALLEWLDGEERLSRSFAAQVDVRQALDRVFNSAELSQHPAAATRR